MEKSGIKTTVSTKIKPPNKILCSLYEETEQTKSKITNNK